MNIEEKISQIDKQIQDLLVQKQQLIEQLTSPYSYNDSWENICNDIFDNYYEDNDEFLHFNINSTTETQSIFTTFLNSQKKYLILDNFFQIPYEYESDYGTKTSYVYASLVIIKYWGNLLRTITNTTISELKKFSKKNFSCLENQNNNLKRLFYEINAIASNVDDCLLMNGLHDETLYEFKKPFSIHAQKYGMEYGKTREFIIAGIIVKEVCLP